MDFFVEIFKNLIIVLSEISLLLIISFYWIDLNLVLLIFATTLLHYLLFLLFVLHYSTYFSVVTRFAFQKMHCQDGWTLKLMSGNVGFASRVLKIVTINLKNLNYRFILLCMQIVMTFKISIIFLAKFPH